MENCKEIKRCLCCRGRELQTVFDMGWQPLANEYHDGSKELPTYPLRLMICPICKHLQLSHAVFCEILFSNYKYLTGTSEIVKKHLRDFAQQVKIDYPKATTVLDIACNDGSQLDEFKKLGFETWGIDPAQNIVGYTRERHRVMCNYFNHEIAKRYFKKTFDIITAQNVFAHIENVDSFLQGCNLLMNEESVLYLQTSQSEMFTNYQYDTIYHEHISFFNSYSMQKLLSRHGLYINSVQKIPVHGSSYLFEVNKNYFPSRIDVPIFIENEKFEFNEENIYQYPLKCYRKSRILINELEYRKGQGYKLIGCGASAKGNVVLNFRQIKLDYILDNTPLKQGLFTPGMNIPIYPEKYLQKEKAEKILFLILSWNLFDEIKANVSKHRKNENDIWKTTM